MNVGEAVQVLREMKPNIAHYDKEARQQIAIHMAIDALKERKTGKWIKFDGHSGKWFCECGCVRLGKHRYCECCGAKMEVDE